MRTPQENQDMIDALEKEIAEKDTRILELEKELEISPYPLDTITKLEKQNARMRECLCRIIEFENCENHFMTYTSSVAKKTLEELEGEE